MSNTVTTLGNSQLAQKQQEIAIVREGPSQVLGYQAMYYWRTFEESGLGVYDFSTIDLDYVQATTGSTAWAPGQAFPGYNAPRRFLVNVSAEDFWNTNPAVQSLPDYILNSSIYGPLGPDGVSNGYWTTNGANGIGSGNTAALWRPAVMDRLIALGQAMAQHVLPDGYTMDTSPYIEGVAMFAETAAVPTGTTDGTYSNDALITQYENLDAEMGPMGTSVAWPHTNVMNMNNYAGTPDATATMAYSFPASGTAAAGPDTFGAAGSLTWGQYAFAGYGSPGDANYNGAWIPGGGTNLQGVVPGMYQIQSTELGYDVFYQPSDIFNQLNTVIKATHDLWSILPNIFPGVVVNGDWWGSATSQAQWNAAPATYGGVLYVITTSSLSQTACPSAYTNGCNTD
jgi:hypothetical protein